MLKALEQWVFPNFCYLCGEPTSTGRDLCTGCKMILPWIEDRCFQCGLALGEGSVYCSQCQDSPPKFDRLCALFEYQPPVIQLIIGLKFEKRLAYGRILGELLADHILYKWYKNGVYPEAVLPVPLHAQRQRARGFNQAVELLMPQSRVCKIPILLNRCKRIQPTPPQSSLNKQGRKRNMKGVFQVIGPLPYEHIAILDDVVTTGSTVNALCEVLKEAGIIRIDVWTICRA